ncbi:glycosyltransferase family 39 protein [Streptomyces verrucosisporus]|uniref:ArnT family glycosyltransferase n=1 Tax=Streptomyces verrucosisporus TaxID=1695161 RepID=UPI0019D19B85|nr:glycosyltransferase family 39 protein [Streptomyces verrucosisporus]MBN3931756.1 glycosyltransferase family 39 protein [Streptomyces verrucosisporus]
MPTASDPPRSLRLPSARTAPAEAARVREPGTRPPVGGLAHRPASAPAGRPRPLWPRLLPVLVLLAALTRAPSFLRPLWNPDEGFLATQARMLADGGTLYDTVVDRKPPLVPWLYQGAFAVFGDASLWPVKAAAVAAVAATAALLASLARRRWGERAAWAAGVLFVLASVGLNPEDAQAANFEVFMLPFTAAALWCADRRHWTAAGLAVAGAFLVKQTGGATLLPVLFLLRRSAPPGDPRRAALLRLGAGCVLPVAVVAAACGWSRFLFWTVTGSGAYASFTGSELHVLGRGLGNTAIAAAGFAGLLVPLAAALRRRPPARRRVLTADLWIWLAAAAVAVVSGFHFFGHYYLQLLPPLALLGAGALHLLGGGWTRRAALCAVLSCALFLGWSTAAGSGELDHARKVADAARRHAGPQEKVLLWGMHPEGYWLADRRPASRYLTAGLLTNFSGGRDGPRVGQRYGVEGGWHTFRAELSEDPPKVIVDDSRGKPYEPSRMPTLRYLLAAYYERAERVDGAVVYVLRPERGEKREQGEHGEREGREERAERGAAGAR